MGDGTNPQPGRRIVQFSTGVGSAEVARREVETYGAANVVLLTADTRAEDPDNWRFAHEVVDSLGSVQWVILADGRTPMQVGRDHRVVPNNRMAVCSRVLKRELLRDWVDDHCDPARDVIVLGFDWTEGHRLAQAAPHWEPFQVAAPLCEPPYLTKAQLLDRFRSIGIEPPRLYAAGFSHANCFGACVRGGQAQWERLLRTNAAVYARWEAEEERTRTMLGKDVSILRDRTRGILRPLTLRVFRERLEAQPSLFDTDDEGACGCFVEPAPVPVELRAS
jgi:hypothetical protein